MGRFKKNIVTSVEEDFSDAPASNQPSEKVAPDGIVSGLGFGIGSKGVVEKCRRICEQIKRIYKIYNENTNINVIRLHFDVFGFSRGATTARMFTYILNPSGEGKEPYNICKNDYKLLTGTENVFLPSKKENFAGKLESKEVRCLGIFDTVSSIGILRDGINKILADKMNLAAAEEFASYGKSIYHDDNVSDFGLYSTEKANNLLHICALDENRANFALVDIENSLNTGTEIFMPGCHTDIGGGCALGQDSIKIINYRYIANKEEIFSDAYDKIKQGVEVARSAKATLDSVLALVKNVRKTMQGIAVTSSGVGAVVGVLATIKNARNSYASAKETLVNSYQLATDVNKLIVDAGNQIKTVDEQAAQDAIGKMERESLIEKAINVVTNSSEELNGIKQAVDNMFDDASNIKEAIEGIKGRKSGKDVVDNASDAIDSAKDIVGSSIETASKIGDFITDINGSIEKVRLNLKNSGQDLTLMRVISDEMNEMLDEFKSIYILTQNICRSISDTVNSPKRKLLIESDTRNICLLNDFPHASPQEDRIVDVSVAALRNLGWAPYNGVICDRKNQTSTGRAKSDFLKKHDSETVLVDKTKTWGNKEIDNVAIYKYSNVGYTNISLRIMAGWANNNDKLFNSIPLGMYETPKDLEDLYNVIYEASKKTGRFFCEPGNYEEYRHIRCKYLHFSSNQQILSPADNGIVNGLSMKPLDENRLLVSRRIYHGKSSKGANDVYLCGLGNGSKKAATLKIDVENDEKFN